MKDILYAMHGGPFALAFCVYSSVLFNQFTFVFGFLECEHNTRMTEKHIETGYQFKKLTNTITYSRRSSKNRRTMHK
jgi:hypothetical protein